MPKANKDGWIRNRGNKSEFPTPKNLNIDAFTKVEVRFRDKTTETGRVYEFDWSIIDKHYDYDIMAYRIIETEDTNVVEGTENHVFVAIDAEKNVMAIDEIKDSIVGYLFIEGFQLETTDIVNITTGEKKKLLDLSHLTNWK